MIDISPSVGCVLTGGACLPTLVPNVGSALAGDTANAVLNVLTSAVSASATWLVGHVIALINQSTTPDLDSVWFPKQRQAMQAVVELVLLPVLMAGSLGAVLKQDFRRLLRVWAIGLPVAIFAGLGGYAFAKFALRATDSMCSVIAVDGGTSSDGTFSHILTSAASSTAPPVVKIIVFALIVVGTVVIWLELLVRMSAIYIAVFFMPLALVGYIWPATVNLAKRAVEILAALILSKFVIVAALVLGASTLQPQGEGSVDGAIAGGAILLITAFAPFTLLRLAPVVEAAAISHLEGLSRRPFRAATQAMTTASFSVMPVARTLLSGINRTVDDSGRGLLDHGPGGTGSGATSSGGSSVVAQALPERRPDYPVGPTGATDG